MQIVVLADAQQKEELVGASTTDNLVWINDEASFLQHRDADAFIDLLFINTAARVKVLQQLLPKPVVVNSVTNVLSETHSSFIRINGWHTFLISSTIEASCNSDESKTKAEEIFSSFNKKLAWLPDEPGFVTASVISMIVNEAFLALAEGVSTKEEINTAMKLGTAYPYGPFEWANKIGLQNIAELLQKLSLSRPRYKPSELLLREADKPTS